MTLKEKPFVYAVDCAVYFGVNVRGFTRLPTPPAAILHNW